MMLSNQFGEPPVIKLHLKLFIETIDDFTMETTVEKVSVLAVLAHFEPFRHSQSSRAYRLRRKHRSVAIDPMRRFYLRKARLAQVVSQQLHRMPLCFSTCIREAVDGGRLYSDSCYPTSSLKA